MDLLSKRDALLFSVLVICLEIPSFQYQICFQVTGLKQNKVGHLFKMHCFDIGCYLFVAVGGWRSTFILPQ